MLKRIWYAPKTTVSKLFCFRFKTLKCADIRDINGNPYQCLPEREAISWPKRCLEHDEALCKFNSKLIK